MAYYARLLESPYSGKLPSQLHTHIRSENLADSRIDYQVPTIEEPKFKRRAKESFKTKPTDVRLPARLSSPLIPYPAELQELSTGSFKGDRNLIHGHHFSQISSLSEVFNVMKGGHYFPSFECRFDIDSLKRFARQSYSSRESLINMSTLAFAQRATAHDLSVAAGCAVKFKVSPSKVSAYTSFLIMIQRLRVHIAKNSLAPEFTADTIPWDHEEAGYEMFTNGVYIYRTTTKGREFCLMACGGHFRIYHHALGYWFCGPTSYLDYVFTIADVLNNLDILRNCNEYDWAHDMFNLLIEFAEFEGHHNNQMEFMKSMEGFLLNMSDYDTEFAMNWKPILEAATDLWELDQSITGQSYDFGLVMALLDGKRYHYPRESFLCRIIVVGKSLSRTHLQEISALHRLIFYAVVDAEAGVKKFLKRVHTPREIDTGAVKNITRFAKMFFLIAYRKRHKSMPHVLGPREKVKLLEVYCQKQSYSIIESLTLSWWDDIKIFDCMDNTLTDDPLEFAKDKGALKNKISFGPGDSRKELLQIIEKEDYTLKDFFGSKTIIPRPKLIRRTCQKAEAEEMSDPARLIEKEREQKEEARLFANAELENKHGLSLVAARMKKALSYFDEQLMTPTDKKRKALIHEASRELTQKDNYSLLLDIEGHNQSMQYENTHELSEFIGNLFGYDGWGDLGHYFSSLTVYHYDEYLDKVIESHGQLGGIEGWLNPLWTLHTTIMMKLMRIMTDVTIKTVMVYSDDVNAILTIPQASEPMVQSVFSKIMKHCYKFGMTVKYSQTNLSKHRITMLRQHYADGIRADSTLKRLISVSAGNNPMIVSEEVEISGICSSSSSAMELSNHHEACSYLKNYKIGLLLSRLPQMMLSHIHDSSMISPEELPAKLSNLLYYSKDDKGALNLLSDDSLFAAAKNDIAAYLGRHPKQLDQQALSQALVGVYGVSVAESRLVDSPDRVLYLQIYDSFIQDLLFYWAYLPCSLGGLGASFHINLMLSGHSVGLSKSLHYLHMWVNNCCSDISYFSKYLTVSLSVDLDETENLVESRLVTSPWPSDRRISSATTSIQQSIKSMVRSMTKNSSVKQMFELSDDREPLAKELVEIFRGNFHSRIVQFYHENTSIHFIDLLISKIETSSGLLTKVRDLTRLRNSMCSRTIKNIRFGAVTSRTIFGPISKSTDLIEYLLQRKLTMFPNISFVEVEEILYDDKIEEVDTRNSIMTIRRCSPTHYRNGIKVFDDPKVGNETLYKGELLDDDRMLGNKEELLAAKLVAVTKWLLMKNNLFALKNADRQELDMIKACNLSLSTLTHQTFEELFHYAPTETGGEILHRIPNIRFSTSTYIRAEMNRSLQYTTELNQQLITRMGLVDSNINFDYLRMRFLVSAIIRDKYDDLRRLVVRYNFSRLIGVKDVQFVSPKRSSHTVSGAFKCYSDLRNHTLSTMRFRYLSHSYLHEENTNEWALIPNLHEVRTAQEVGRRYVDDIIYRYARDLDKDYMSISPALINEGVWSPLISKLYRIIPSWREDTTLSDTDEIRDRLIGVMRERARMTTVDKTNRVQLALQSSCLEHIEEFAPDDKEFQALVGRYSRITQNRRHSMRSSIRLTQYKSLLSTYNNHKFALVKSLLHEYIITFHFHVKAVGSDIRIDADACVDDFLEHDMGKFSFMLINPDLQVRLMILGFEYVERVVQTDMIEIREELRDICNDISFADIVMPTSLPSLPTHTTLTGDEVLPAHCDESVYIHSRISYPAMSSLNHIIPLCKYAHRCSITGATPQTFTSLTGSDSLLAQIGLFKTLLSMNIIDKGSKICDLTAGRGDGVYAAKYLGLSSDAYAREDTFTRINHHPSVVFKNDYDIFDGSTLKFVTAYDFVHIDISFTGSNDANILDLILFLEENSLSYSIRLNSVACMGYPDTPSPDRPVYAHHIAYAGHSHLKPYQIYLIGIPSADGNLPGANNLKDSMAFRSMALAFSSLLSPSLYTVRLHEYDPNSASMYVPQGHDLHNFLITMCTNSLESEQLYYSDRFLAEVGEDSVLAFSANHLDPRGRELIDRKRRIFSEIDRIPYGRLSPEDIGNVSDISHPYHVLHVEALKQVGQPFLQVKMLNCDEEVLEYFRSHHPLSEVRSWCNIVLGLFKFCRQEVLSGFNAISDSAAQLRRKTPAKLSLHQREIYFALKLLVLAVRDDDYTYGLRYCHGLMSDRSKSVTSTSRILRYYRLVGYLFDDIQWLVHHGYVPISNIHAISSELEIREKQRYKYRRQTEMETKTQEYDGLLDSIIENSIDDLFSGLEAYASNIVKAIEIENPIEGLTGGAAEGDMRFDIGLADHVDYMIQKLNLKPSGPHGYIDLGDDDVVEYDDW